MSLVVAERKVSSWNDLTLVLVSLTVQVRFFTLVVSLVAGSSFKVSRMVKIDLTLSQPQEPGVDIFLGVGLGEKCGRGFSSGSLGGMFCGVVLVVFDVEWCF